MPQETRLTITGEEYSPEEEPYDFERAMEACGFGIFNIFLMFAALPGLWASVFEATIMSFVIPAAECDLNLSLMDKGALNAIAFAGMLVSAFGWAFLADTFGRKYILVIGLYSSGFLTLLSIVSQTSTQLMIFKFFGGFTSCGPLAVFFSYISEFHGKKYRLFIGIIIGFINSLPLIVLPSMATVLLRPEGYNIGSFELNSWKTFIAVSSIPALLSASLIMLFPESPKFLMAQGKNDKAIKAFALVYAVNKCKKKKDYPITVLMDEAPLKTARRNSFSERRPSLEEKRNELKIQLREGLEQLKELCSRQYLMKTLLVCAMHFPMVFAVYSVRLWQPQYFTSMRQMESEGSGDVWTCRVIDYILNKSRLIDQKPSEDCKVNIPSVTYVDTIKIGTAVCINYILTTIFVKLVDNNVLLRIYLVITSACLLAVYWAKSIMVVLLLFAFLSAYGIVSLSLVLNTSINLYPTSMRTMALVILMTCGRTGSVVGNLVLPLLMSVHCIAVFLVNSMAIASSLAISFFLKNTTKDALK